MIVLLRLILIKMLNSPKKLLPLFFPALLGLLFGAFIFTFTGNLRSSLQQRSSPMDVQWRKSDADLILVGLMTAQRYLDTRALQIWRTWARHIPGRIIFFVAEQTELSSQVQQSGMPIVRLRGVDDSYPPQKKSFAMLRWMYDNQLANFHWFMRADDDLYVRSDRLKDFLLSLDPDKAHLIGQAGLGNTLEYGQLSLGAQDNYCMGGPGVIFSRETLRQLAPHLESCMRQLLTTHEDVELDGASGLRHIGLACPWNYEMQTLFHNNASVAALYSSKLAPQQSSSLPLRRLITLHPVKQPAAMRQIHWHAQLLRLNKMRRRQIELLEELEDLARQRINRNGETAAENTLGQQMMDQGLSAAKSAHFAGLIPKVPNESRQVPRWEFISTDSKLLFCLERPNCPRHTLEAEWRRALSSVVIELFDQFNSNARQRGRTLHFQTLQYGYVRVQPRFGVDLVLDLALWYRRFRGPFRTPLAVRRHAYVQQRFGPLQCRPLRNREEHGEIIHVIVALKGRSGTFARFAQNLVKLVEEGGGGRKAADIELVIVHYSSTTEDQSRFHASLAQLKRHLLVRLVEMPSNKEFSRGEALSTGAAQLPAQALLFFTDVDVLIRWDALDRVRLNTVAGKQVYFPIVFSEFSPDTWGQQQQQPSSSAAASSGPSASDDHFVFDQRRGYFRHFGYGIVSIYRQDFEAVGGFNLTIRGWGLEDVDLFERIVAAPALLQLFRAPDPGLVHIFHPIDCAVSKEGGNHQQQSKSQRQACEGTRAQSMASLDFLAEQLGPLF